MTGPAPPPTARTTRTTRTTRSSRTERARSARLKRDERQRLARGLAAPQEGVVTWAMLMGAGLTRGEIQVELTRGTWRAVGRHTVSVTGAEPTRRALWFRALWESGRSAVLDGPTALLAAGLAGWTESTIHVSVRNNATVRRLPGVRHHRLRDPGTPVAPAGLRRTAPEVAVVRAAQWAVSDRQAATLVAMTVQQGLLRPEALLHRWAQVGYSARRRALDGIIRDVCDGAHSMNELDFARECRRRGLPEPSRQVLRPGRAGRVYLDVYWDDLGVHVEIQGAHHFRGTAGIDDALRVNDLGLRDRQLISLQIPVLGLRSCPDLFMDQVEQALATARRLREHRRG